MTLMSTEIRPNNHFKTGPLDTFFVTMRKFYQQKLITVARIFYHKNRALFAISSWRR